MTRRRTSGFTLVELIIVIIVIAILATITTVLYMGAQVQARDLKNADAGTKIADSIQLFIAKYQHFPAGGWGSSAPIGSGNECANGANGFAAHGLYTCTIEDTLVASGYLPAGYIASLSPNKSYPATPYADGRASVMVYTTGSNDAMVMYSLEAPTSSTMNHFNSQLTKCLGSVPGSYAPRDTYGMDDGICVTY